MATGSGGAGFSNSGKPAACPAEANSPAQEQTAGFPNAKTCAIPGDNENAGTNPGEPVESSTSEEKAIQTLLRMIHGGAAEAPEASAYRDE